MNFLHTCAKLILAIYLSGCQHEQVKPFETKSDQMTRSEFEKTNLFVERPKELSTDSPIEDIMAFKLRRLKFKDSRFNEILINEKHKFRKMASACFPKAYKENDPNIPIHGEILPPLQLEKDVYFLRLKCMAGRGASTYSLFIYQPQKGVKDEALKIDIMSINNLGILSKLENTRISYRSMDYDEINKRIIVSVLCHTADGYTASRTIYKYEGERLQIVEYWQDYPDNKRCLQKPNLKLLYKRIK